MGFLAFALIALSISGEAGANNPCDDRWARLVSPAPSSSNAASLPTAQSAYSPDDFPLSNGWFKDSKYHDQYAEWAADLANEAAADLSEGELIPSVLGGIARSRRNLAIHLQDSNADSMGKLRDPADVNPDWWESWRTGIARTHGSDRDFVNKNLPILARLADRLEKRILASGQKLLPGSHLPRNEYVTLQGDRIQCSAVGIGRNTDPPMIRIFHSSPANGVIIFDDVQTRLRNLLKSKGPDSEKVREYAYLLYGYYNAMPYERGSSAIGRSFFAGAYSAIFKKKLQEMPDIVDMHAMTMDFDEFYEFIRPYLTR